MSTPSGDIKENQRQAQLQAWSAGDFSTVGAGATMVGEYLSEAVRLHAGERVLDVATGSGNTALAAARRGTEVVGVDFVPALLERARERAHAERFKHVRFEYGDTEELPFPAGSFDVVLSTFGHMFAPDPRRAASEMVRVCRPGGRIGFAAWTPEGFVGAFFRAAARFNPPPPGLAPPPLWGKEEVVRERFPEATGFAFERRHHNFRALDAEQWVAFMRQSFGPLKVTFEKLDPPGQEALAKELAALAAAANTSGDATLYVPAEYLEAVVYL
jgi:SAM-dependent methyltransferase